MYKLKPNQLGHYCSFCKEERASHRTKYFTHYSCESCLPTATKVEQQNELRESHFTEADYQSWNK